MQLFYLVFKNSFDASFMLSLHGELHWFVARAFGTYDMMPLTIATLLGSCLSMSINYGLGYCVSKWRDNAASFDNKRYDRASLFFSKYLAPLLLLQFFPLIGIFAAIAGIFRVPPKVALSYIIAGRIAYYGYYLLHT